ncbi:hypothetical protein [Vibrio parahaemolyticus]|uniref:hypothetical protein n=1 Tax=Vibrio parahaemolyticus TaxID=670 RepID=UPI001120A83A|nr:hypothetical protein [Vibrio parahaemolyticus]TOL90931.1 hypothetical protein CGH88_19375 [Vibrio parahaemolyticus]
MKKYFKDNWIAILALIVSIGAIIPLYHVDYDMKGYVKLNSRPQNSEEPLILTLAFINSGNQNALITDIGLCFEHGYNAEESLIDSCGQLFFVNGSDSPLPIYVETGNITTKNITMSDILSEPYDFELNNKQAAHVNLQMWFKIISSDGVVYKKVSQNTGVSVSIFNGKYRWNDNMPSSKGEGVVMDLGYTVNQKVSRIVNTVF